MPSKWERCRWSSFPDYCDVHRREIVPGCIAAALDQVDGLLKENADLREKGGDLKARLGELDSLIMCYGTPEVVRRYDAILKGRGPGEAPP